MFVRSPSLRSRSSGFTLVELMVVVAVIGIGGGLALFNMSEQVTDARERADGHAMIARIKQEHRTAKERMLGLTLHTGTNKNVLKFQYAQNCRPILGTAFESPPFMKSTNLVIVDGTGAPATYCWDATGQPADPAGGGGGTIIDPSGPITNDDSNTSLVNGARLPAMGVVTGAGTGRTRPGILTQLTVTQVGVSPGVKTSVPAGANAGALIALAPPTLVAQ